MNEEVLQNLLDELIRKKKHYESKINMENTNQSNGNINKEVEK